MSDLNPSTNISAYIQTIYEDAMLVARDNSLMVNLVNVFSDRVGLAVRTRSEYGTAIIRSIAETDDLTGQVFTPVAGSSLTPGEVGAQFTLTDSRVDSDPFGVRADAALELGQAGAESIDTALCSTFSSLTGGTVGAAGTIITWGHFFAMQAILRNRKAPKPWVFVCHPYHWHRLGKAAAVGATVTNAPSVQDSIARNYFIQNVSGVDIYVDANIPTISGDDARCAMFSRTAIGYDERRALRLEYERDASRRAWELNLTAVYAAGVWRPKWGVQGLFDVGVPTS